MRIKEHKNTENLKKKKLRKEACKLFKVATFDGSNGNIIFNFNVSFYIISNKK